MKLCLVSQVAEWTESVGFWGQQEAFDGVKRNAQSWRRERARKKLDKERKATLNETTKRRGKSRVSGLPDGRTADTAALRRTGRKRANLVHRTEGGTISRRGRIVFSIIRTYLEYLYRRWRARACVLLLSGRLFSKAIDCDNKDLCQSEPRKARQHQAAECQQIQSTPAMNSVCFTKVNIFTYCS